MANIPLIQNTKDSKYLTQRIPGGTIFFQMRRDGKKLFESLNTTSPSDARIKRASLIMKYSKDPDVQAELHKKVTVSELIDDYLLYLRNRNKVSADNIEQDLNMMRNH